MIASLMMYARPELADAHERYWALIRHELGARGINAPAVLSNETDAVEVWEDPELVLSQTCGMPYRLDLHEKVTLIGTPDYGLDGCSRGYYRSAVVVNRDAPQTGLEEFAKARFAYNGAASQSGYAAIYDVLHPLGFWFEDRVQSGSHQASARMVAQGDADIAALDAVTWTLIQRYDDFAGALRVLCWTPPTPGLPYISAAGADRSACFDAVSAAIVGLSAEDRAALCLNGFVSIPKDAYLSVPNPPSTQA